jgi:hypothetical protein
MSLKYKKNIYHLLTNKNLLVLSYNQIITCPENFVFDINLRYALSKDKAFFLQNKMIKSIQTEVFFILNNKKPNSFKNNKQITTLFRQLSLKNLIIQQVVINILNIIFDKAKQSFPINFIISKNRSQALNKFKKALQNANIGLQFKNIQILNKSHLIHFFKIIKQIIYDKKFIVFLEQFVLNVNFDIINLKYSKFYKIFCNICLIHLDYCIIQFCKKKTTLFLNDLIKKNKNLKQTESLVLKALTFIKNKKFLTTCFTKRLKIYTKLTKTTQKFYYIRYIDSIFFGIYNKSIYSDLLNLNVYIPFFCKSFLNIHLKPQTWLTLSTKKINFFAVNYKKITYNSSVKKIIIKDFAPLQQIKQEFLKYKILAKNNKPKSLINLVNLYTKSIINWYNHLMFGLLYYYKKCLNYKKLICHLYYYLKWSLLYTLKKKHKKSIEKIVLNYLKKFSKQKQLVTLKQNSVQLLFLNRRLKTLINFYYVYKYFL